MAGIYVHIPFCKSRCIYCGFYSSVLSEWKERYVDALCREITKIVKSSNRDIVKSIYLGGGTPSQLTIPQLQRLFSCIHDNCSVARDAEVTIECNPDDVTEEFASALASLPVNRVSMGAQTFRNERLQFLHRRHTAKQVGKAVERLRTVGIRNVSIDLMFGFPGETLEEWQSDIVHALELDVEHISAYSLMYEEGTVLNERKERGEVTPINEELSLRMYETLIDRLEGAGFEHYEISNFAKRGFRSRHNSSYWNGTSYIGIGAAAHSYDGTHRWWNVADVKEYCHRMEQGLSSEQGREYIDDTTRYNELIMTRLRTVDGIDLATLPHPAQLLRDAQPFIDNQLLEIHNNHLHFTRKGLFISDSIMSDLMKV